MKKLFTVFFVSLFTACASTAPEASLPTPPTKEEILAADYGAFPTNYQEVIKKYVSTNLKDPESARYEFLTQPSRGYLLIHGRKFGWTACVSVNAKNSYGGYSGSDRGLLLLQGDKVVDSTYDGNETSEEIGRHYCSDAMIKQSMAK